METRKVQLSGGTTYTVSLPKSWATEHGIEAGAGLRLHPRSDGTLLVETTAVDQRTERTASVDASALDAAELARMIRALYVVGVDSITLCDRSTGGSERRRVATGMTGGLNGLEVIEETEDEITLRNLIDSTNVSIHKSVRRLKLIALAMHRDAVTAMLSENETLTQDVIDRDDEADKLFALVTRYFRRSLSDLQEIQRLGHSRDELFEYYHAARQLERVADHAVRIARLTHSEHGVEQDTAQRLSSYADRARTIVDHAADVLLSDAHVSMAHDATEQCDRLVSEIGSDDHGLYDRTEPTTIHRISLFLESTKRTAEYGANIADMAVRQTVRQNQLNDP